MEYLNEHLWVGKLGIFFVGVFVLGALFSFIIYTKAAYFKNISGNEKLFFNARVFYISHFIAIILIFILLYVIIFNHFFEFSYAYQHSNLGLPIKYILSCFWEGQEGSFLLWSFWNGFIGLFFIWKFKKWESQILSIVSLLQFFLSIMILGTEVFGVKIGVNPFTLLRHVIDAPIFSQPTYLLQIKDGNGLNALLQNYWMVIHPPILFLGFSLFVFPFAFVISSLIKRDYIKFAQDILPWSIVAACVLGLGVMMGAAWAYESLTFGGYWAWDPVENASLVPWLIMVAAIHTNIIYNKTKRALRLTMIFYILGFLLVLYSTYLTRSGILGDASVHSFTDLGLQTQLLLFLLVFVIGSFLILIINYKKIPTFKGDEENTSSREFLMVIGSLVLMVSAGIITFKTSLPVINKIFNTKFAPPDDVEFSFNSIQILIALVVNLLSGLALYFKFKKTNLSEIKNKIIFLFVISLILSISLIYFLPITFIKKGWFFDYAIKITVIISVFSFCANFYFIIKYLKNKFLKYGAALSHLGFALLILGILISSSGKQILSWNTIGFSPLKEGERESPKENITLVKGVRTEINKYFVTYENSDSLEFNTQKYFYKIKLEDKRNKEIFFLYPDVIKNTKGQEGLTPNPDSKHYLLKDIFIYITYLQNTKTTENENVSTKDVELKIKDTFFYSHGYVKLLSVNKKLHPHIQKMYANLKLDTGVTAEFEVNDRNGSRYLAHPSMAIKNGELIFIADTLIATNIVLNFSKILENHKFSFKISEPKTSTDFITLKVLEFPFINLVWLGILVMIIGMIISTIKHFKRVKK